MTGRVESIHLAHREGEPTFAVERVEVVPETGLAGDRLVRKAEAAGETVKPRRQVTLIEAEALEALARDYQIDLSAAESRRNICTRGAALNHLVGREFRVGDVRLRGIELCEPCGLLERLSGKPGARKGLIHRGGLRAEVLTGGIVGVGDPIVPV
jgi:MOSC domain-containing protein YiiM